MRIFFSGGGSMLPEDVLGDEADIMLSFYDMDKGRETKPTPRFQAMLDSHESAKKLIPKTASRGFQEDAS